MSDMVLSIAAGVDRGAEQASRQRSGNGNLDRAVHDLPEHTFPARTRECTDQNLASGVQEEQQDQRRREEDTAASGESETQSRYDSYEERRQRRILRGRTVAMLRRYMRYSIETGRLPSLLGREFFRAKVTAYIVVTFEDRVIFVHDMETCLNRLDEFSRQLIARHILQEHDQAQTAKLLNCAERTVRTYVPMALDLLSDILVEVGLLEPVVPIRENTCQGGEKDEISVSNCEHGKNNF